MDGRTRIRCNFALRTGHTGGRGRCVLRKETPKTEQVLEERVNLVIQNRSESVDRQAAEGTLAAFFSSNKVSGFNVNHEGKRDESSFIIGTLTTANGNFRINCFFRRVQNKYLINQIRIDKTNE